MRLYLTTAYKQGLALHYLREAWRADRHRVHEVVETPDAADVILFVENGEAQDPLYRRLLSHPLVKRERERVFMYNEWDHPYCTLPGLYASMPRRSFDPARQAAFSYLFTPNEFVRKAAISRVAPCYLFSFVGARSNHSVRARALALSDPRAYLENTDAFSIWACRDVTELARRKRRYSDVLSRSKFVLCPRGAGTSSYRFFETLETGRVPVVISDQWVPPEGPDWSFLVRIQEAEVECIPDILREFETEALDRGRAARRAWEAYFAPDVIFHHVGELLAGLKERLPAPVTTRRQLPDPEYLRLRLKFALRPWLLAGRGGLRSFITRPVGPRTRLEPNGS